MTLAPDHDPQLGRTLGGQYRVEALLGCGGMGRVYRGVQLSVMRPVAIKLIAGVSPHPREWVQRFRREAEATARLSSPNSVRLYDFGVTDTQELYMVMELLEGSDLGRHLLEHGRMQLPAALSVARQILLALAEAHALGIVHRDVKPENVFLARVPGGDVIAKVMDFGIAGLERGHSSGKLTSTGVVIGTPTYMSPEQAQGHPVDAKSDMYSLGVVLFEMLSGRPVFESHTVVTLLVQHVTQRPKRLDEVGVHIPQQAGVQSLLDGFLAKEPRERPTARDALVSVGALAGELAEVATKPSVLVRSRVADTSGAHPSVPRPRTSLSVLIAAGVLLSTALALALRWAPAWAAALRNTMTSGEVPTAPQHCVTIASVPKSASVLLDGAELGTTPYEFCARETTELSVLQHGYERQLVQVTPNSPARLTITLVHEPIIAPEPRAAKPQRRVTTISAARDQPEPPAPDPPPIHASPDVERAREDVPEPDSSLASMREAEEEQEASHNRGLKIFGRAVMRAVGKLVIPYPDRERRQVLADQPLAYSSFREARRAYERKAIDRTGFEEAVWQLRERRRQGIQAERDAFARGDISQGQFDARVDHIWAEFWGR